VKRTTRQILIYIFLVLIPELTTTHTPMNQTTLTHGLPSSASCSLTTLLASIPYVNQALAVAYAGTTLVNYLKQKLTYSAPHENQFASWQAADFKTYFEQLAQKEKVTKLDTAFVFAQYQWYQFPAFRAYLQTFDNYVQELRAFFEKYFDDERFSKSVQKKAQCDYKNMLAIVHKLQDEIYDYTYQKFCDEQAKERKQLLDYQACIKQISTDQKKELEKLLAQYEDASQDQPDAQEDLHITARAQAVKTSLETDSSYENQSYQLSKSVIDSLQALNLNPSDYYQCWGNHIQQHMHAEFIQILDNAAQLKPSCQDKQGILLAAAKDFADVGRAYNQSGRVTQAIEIADFCWSVIDYTRAAVEGVIQGVGNTAHAVFHPQDTLTNMLQGTVAIAYHLARVLVEVAKIGVIVGADAFHQFHATLTGQYDSSYELLAQLRESKRQLFQTSISSTYHAIKQKIKETSGRDIVKNVTAFATEWYLTGKCLSAAAPVFKSAKRQATTLIRNIKEAEFTPQLVASAGGIEVQVAADTAEALMSFNQAEQTIQNAAAATQAVTTSSSWKLLQTTQAVEQYVPLAQELSHLEKMFNGIRTFANKAVTFSFEHFFEGEIYRNGKLGGFHHDYLGNFRKANPHLVQITKQLPHGFYEAEVYCNGRWFTKTFFPDAWDRPKIMYKVFEAFDNSASRESGLRTILTGTITEGIEIETIIEKNARIITSYAQMPKGLS
jgi:hypothetical protein